MPFKSLFLLFLLCLFSNVSVADANQQLASVRVYNSHGTNIIGNGYHGPAYVSSVGLCSYSPSTSVTDGCSNAPTTNLYTIQYSNFFNGYAQQSVGVTGSLQPSSEMSNRPAWNVAGVDYPVGIRSTALPLKDPANIASDPLIKNMYGTSICTYNSTTPMVVCNGNDYGLGITISGYDFSLHNGTYLNVSYGLTGPITITDSNFKYGSNIGKSGLNRPYLINVGVGSSLIFSYNVLDGVGASFDSGVSLVNYGGQSATFTYNAFLRAPARFITSTYYGSTLGNFTYKYNYGEGLTYVTNALHGEQTLFVWSGILDTYDYENNTFLEPSSTFMDSVTNGITGSISPSLSIIGFTGSIASGVLTVTSIDASSGGPNTGVILSDVAGHIPSGVVVTGLISGTAGSIGTYSINNSTLSVSSEEIVGTDTITNFIYNNNVNVNNLASVYPTKATNGAASLEIQMVNITNATILNNYTDPTGAWYCNKSTGTPINNINMSGNKNLIDGSTIIGFGATSFYGYASSGILTVTSMISGAVIPSSVSLSGSGVSGTIVSNRTGTGSTGTYNISSSSTFGSSSTPMLINIYGEQGCTGAW
jgi:hypothetical protein